jgi:hypothetical protein
MNRNRRFPILSPICVAFALAFTSAPPAYALGANHQCDWKGDLTTAGPLQTARAGHTATALSDGSVLVVGGGGLQTSEIFDPGSGNFRFTAGPLKVPRYFHTATRLMNGMVLIAAGSAGALNLGALSSAELFDPASGSFLPLAGSLRRERLFHTASLLQTGEVMLVGGQDRNGHPVSEIEIFDPATGTFRVVGHLNQARSNHSATQRIVSVGDDEVLVAGGASSHAATDSVESIRYDAGCRCISGITAVGPLLSKRQDHSATRLLSGEILVVGGSDGSGRALDSMERIGRAGGTFAVGTLRAARSGHNATLLPSGQVLLTGGVNGQAVAEVEIFDDEGLGTTRLIGVLREPRFYAAAVELPLGQALIVGGFVGPGVQLAASTELYDPFWGSVGPLNLPRAKHSATLLPGGRVLLAGGDPGFSVAHGEAELFNVWAGYSDYSATQVTARTEHEATSLSKDLVLLTGGAGYAGGPSLAAAELYDARRNRFMRVGSMEMPRVSHQATRLRSGEVMVSGGTGGGQFIAQVELFDPALNRFRPGPAMPKDVTGHGAVLLPSGEVLISGGLTQLRYSAALVVHDPIQASYQAANPSAMFTHRSGHIMALIPGTQKALVVGGMTIGNQPTDTFEAVPGGGQGRMSQRRSQHSLSPLKNQPQQFWVIGGTATFNGLPLPDVEMLDGIALQSSPVPGLGVGRSLHRSTLLPDGRVLLTGGRYGHQKFVSATALVSKSSDCSYKPPSSIVSNWRWPDATTWPWKTVRSTMER